MSQVLTVSDELYQELEAIARHHGLSSIEQLIKQWMLRENELDQRWAVVRDIDRIRQQLFAKYGEMPDSVDLIRDDRK